MAGLLVRHNDWTQKILQRHYFWFIDNNFLKFPSELIQLEKLTARGSYAKKQRREIWDSFMDLLIFRVLIKMSAKLGSSKD